MSMRDLEALSSIDPITKMSTSTGNSECIHREGKTEILRQRDAGTEGATKTHRDAETERERGAYLYA